MRTGVGGGGAFTAAGGGARTWHVASQRFSTVSDAVPLKSSTIWVRVFLCLRRTTEGETRGRGMLLIDRTYGHFGVSEYSI